MSPTVDKRLDAYIGNLHERIDKSGFEDIHRNFSESVKNIRRCTNSIDVSINDLEKIKKLMDDLDSCKKEDKLSVIESYREERECNPPEGVKFLYFYNPSKAQSNLKRYQPPARIVNNVYTENKEYSTDGLIHWIHIEGTEMEWYDPLGLSFEEAIIKSDRMKWMWKRRIDSDDMMEEE